MRLHDLEVSAFGPFAGTVRVDFDELNDAGLFLMTGATGAGKSSLLDAVCFALYGTVPGARGVKTLKSQHASADAKPEVVLDFTVQGRRFVVRRTPEWTRPKRRGTGMLTEKASATILEKTGGAERLLSARAAEVGLTVSGLMGMNAGQFVQVALLPQGEFQTFLRATSQERHDVLQQLFRTDRFARIEDWVGDHSRRLVMEADSGRCTVQRILDTVADRAGVALPEPVSGDGLASAAAEGRVLPWVEGVLGAAVEDARVAQDGHDRAQLASRDARQRHDAAQRHVEERRRRDAARQALAALEASEPAAVSAREALAAHDRATRCRPFLDLRDRAAAALDEAVARRDRAVRALSSARPEIAPPVPDELSADGLSTLLDTVRSRVARLEALVPRQQAAESAGRERDMDLERLVAAERDLHEVGVRAELLPAEIEARSVTSGEAAAASAHRHELAVALDGARARYDAAVRLAEGGPELRALDDARRDARDRVQDAREHLQSLVARRLAGMAAELAGALVDGAPCQVCGSTEHPHRGTPAVDAVTDADHRRADQLLLAATSAHDAAEQAFRELQRRHDALRETASGTSPGQATAEVVALARQLAEARAARDEHARLEEELVALRAELAAVGRRQAAAAALVAGLRTSVAAHDRTLATVTAEVAEALGDELGQSSLREAVLGLTAWCDVLAESRRALDDLTAAHTRLSEATTQALGAASEHGFGSLAEVAGALVADGVRTRTEAQLRDRADTQARVRAVLDDPDAPTDEDDPPTDPDALRREAARGDQDAAVAARRLALHEDRVLSLTRSLDRLTDAMDAWAPIRDEALRAEAISRLVRGMGHDNQLQMRLSAYVLATRLDQVVAAANERLGHLRDQRYLLQRTGRAERRSSQAGLGLEVVDQWTGDVRAPATLSGGETFVVSLSLALGLADVVTHESGGTEIETLFVDEGFGTLDADTLDDVMDRLDGLRAGGRTVGVVSHVTELRNRIPTQVHVEKGRAGSTVTVRTLVG